MSRIKSKIQTESSEFKSNYNYNKGLADELKQRQHDARYERPQKDIDRLAGHGKLMPRQRLEKLLDPGTPFLEFSTLAGSRAGDAGSPSASCITGIGVVSGQEVIIIANDSSIKGGAWYPLTVKKIVRALDIAIENRTPVVHLCDSAGGFLPLQSELFPDRYMAGRMFRNQSTLSKMGVKQLALVFGHCTAGGAYVPALSDYSVIVRGTGAVFLAGPPLVKAATGEIVSADDLGGCDLHTQVSGVCDYPADTEEEAIAIGREIVGQWEKTTKWQVRMDAVEAPYYDPDDLYGILPTDIKKSFDMKEVIARIVDGSRFHEYQPVYGTTMICGFANIWGYKVGILGNNGVIFNDSALKAAHFIELCNQNNTPILFLQNVTGFMVGKEYEAKGISKDGAKLIQAIVGSHVPKFTLMCHGSFGAGNYGMCGRAYDPRFVFSWPNHQIGIMGGEQAAKTLVDVKKRQMERTGEQVEQKTLDKIYEETLEAFQEQMSTDYATSELWDDGIINPIDTRNTLGIAISASLNAQPGEPGYGIFRF
jgi:3-methylcrotonyl-CoA carboxylase beta subunit